MSPVKKGSYHCWCLSYTTLIKQWCSQLETTWMFTDEGRAFQSFYVDYYIHAYLLGCFEFLLLAICGRRALGKWNYLNYYHENHNTLLAITKKIKVILSARRHLRRTWHVMEWYPYCNIGLVHSLVWRLSTWFGCGLWKLRGPKF